MSSEGMSVYRICRTLNTEGVPSPNVHKKWKDGRTPMWGKCTILEILKDRSYVGDPMFTGKSKVIPGKRIKETGRSVTKRTKKDEWKQLAVATPEIITQDLFDAANAMLISNKKSTGIKGTWRMLKGMVFCGVCGKTMTCQTIAKWTKSQGRYHFYKCMSGLGDRLDNVKCGNGRTQIPYAEAEVWRIVSNAIGDKDNLRRAIEANTKPDESLDADLAVHQEEQDKARKAIKRLVDRLASEDDDDMTAMINSKMDALKRTISDHKKAGDALRQRMGERDRVVQLTDMVTEIMESLIDLRIDYALGKIPKDDPRLDTIFDNRLLERMQVVVDISDPQKRQLLLALGVKVFLKKEEVRVEMNVPVAESVDSSMSVSSLYSSDASGSATG
jgi:hypothetical protein